ncbi:hypothetical protein AN958_03037 [Leucoagaricus sp. SymC.cos]|nr:hypothetical protein AN958_03037 [Leucoagaricus sp. SymC.cos]
MDIQDLLQSNSARLLTAYRENIDHVLDLQTTLIRDILPSVVDEFDLSPDATEWATEWLNDTDYGGALPLLTDLDDPLRPGRIYLRPSTEDVIEDQSSLTTSHQPTSGYIASISPTSMLNPFYGYPAASGRGYLQLHHGRRRKRDLARTLVWLFWLRWRPHITVGAVIAALTIVINFGVRKGLPRAPRIFGWRASVSSALRSP